MVRASLSLRPAASGDEAFLLSLRHLTMTEHLHRVGEPTTAEAHGERMRHRFGDIRIVVLDGEAIGMVKAFREADAWVLQQVQILPSHQGAGLGRWVVEGVIAAARASGLPVRLSVLDGNPARRLYERLGFRAVGRAGNETVFVLEALGGGGGSARGDGAVLE
jgi:GNAT superfamily N-acetyltransferase